MTTMEMLERAKQAVVPQDKKNAALREMAKALLENTELLLSENQRDMENANGHISDVMLDRLLLTKERIAAMAQGMEQVAELPDPCGEILEEKTRPNGLRIQKVTVPMGVIAVIYESRPNVTSDAAALAIKAGSRCVLRCGKEAHASALAITNALKTGLERAGVSPDALFLVEDTSRESASELMNARGLVDLLIPRGGKGLIRACVEQAKVPVLETGTGICHIYADASCDPNMALSVIENAKCSRPSVCNACEVCLVHQDIAAEFLPKLRERLNKVELRLDERAAAIIPGQFASATDFDTEFLDYILAVKVVKDVREAVAHIARHSTGHSEAILATDETAIAYFTQNVDSAAVYVNASTRFTDGGEFGLGCEMGISTQKLHARGPVGLKELCSYKTIITGNGQIR